MRMKEIAFIEKEIAQEAAEEMMLSCASYEDYEKMLAYEKMKSYEVYVAGQIRIGEGAVA